MSETMNKLQSLLKTKAALEADIAAEKEAADHKEQLRINAERDVKAAEQQAAMDRAKYIGTNDTVDKILEAIGKQALKDPRTPIVVAYLLATTKDRLGQQTPKIVLEAIAAYFRHANSIKKDG
jgi:hemoglobin-like flavoprotein